jgi:uncharacterized protein (DUF302 family)
MKLLTQSLLGLLLVSTSLQVGAVDGLTVVASPHDVATTMDRLASTVDAAGMKVFARIDHAAGAAKVDQVLRPTQLLIFGNPKGGTPFMQCAQTVGIDLPLKMLAWEDESGKVWLGYTDPAYVAQRHDVGSCAVVPNIARALEGFANEAVR